MIKILMDSRSLSSAIHLFQGHAFVKLCGIKAIVVSILQEIMIDTNERKTKINAHVPYGE